MIPWSHFPLVLRRKFLLTMLAGAASVSISGMIYFTTKDRTLLTLGGVLFCICLVSCKEIWSAAARKNYEVVEGVCSGISAPMLRRYCRVQLADTQGAEITLLLPKSVKLKVGGPYRFYFQEGSRPAIGNDYLDAALSTNSLLGYEEYQTASEDSSSPSDA